MDSCTYTTNTNIKLRRINESEFKKFQQYDIMTEYIYNMSKKNKNITAKELIEYEKILFKGGTKEYFLFKYKKC